MIAHEILYKLQDLYYSYVLALFLTAIMNHFGERQSEPGLKHRSAVARRLTLGPLFY